jgi:hypothetical protein
VVEAFGGYEEASWQAARACQAAVYSAVHLAALELSPLVRNATSMNPTKTDKLLRVAIKLFKFLGDMAKKMLGTKGTKVDLAQDVSPSMRNVVAFVSNTLKTSLYLVIKDMDAAIATADREGNGSKKAKADTGRRLSRAAATVPSLIYEIEQWEGHLAVLSKKAKMEKHNDITRLLQRSTARDFRLSSGKVDEMLARREDVGDMDDMGEGGGGGGGLRRGRRERRGRRCRESAAAASGREGGGTLVEHCGWGGEEETKAKQWKGGEGGTGGQPCGV